jgi:OmcA/MtrC family decaheme c-type cytochrome
MTISSLHSIGRLGFAALVAAGLAGCGGGGDGGGGGGGTTPATTAVITAAAANPAGTNTANNPKQAFGLIQGAGLTPVTVNSPPVVNFTVVDKNGQIVKGLTTSNISFAIAKLVPGADGNPDQWVNYIYRTETPPATVGPNGAPVLASAKQATTDAKTATQLTFNDAGGYYTYTFSTDIKDTTKTNGVVFEPSRTHRVAIQLSYNDADGTAIKVNPYFDFTVDANGKSVAVTDATKTRVMADIANCNTCHNQLALHGGGRVDVQYCVMCHNPGTVDANSGNNLDLKQMVHKIHSGRRLHAEGHDYKIWGYGNSEHNYAEVGFPQDLRNCSKCHTGTTATPQGDNWKNKPSKEACLTCHTSDAASDWHNLHITTLKLGTSVANIDNNCTSCHGAGKTWSAEQMHWNQNEENAAKYKVVVDSATYNSASRKVTVQYHVDDTTNGNAKWNLTSDCTGACTTSNRFGNIRFIVGYNNIPGQSTSVTEFASYNNGGSGAGAYARDGVNNGSNVYTVDITIPADVAGITEAKGTARVITYGQVKEPELDIVTRTAKAPQVLINVSALHTFKDFAISGALTPRKEIVSNEKCNACHGLLGTASGSNELNNAFHSGARNTVESCGGLCHDAGRGSTTLMNADFKFPASVLGGTATANTMNESYHFKRMIHGIHGGSRKQYDFMHGTDNITAEVAYPGILADCNTCHVNESYKNDRGTLGSVVISSSSAASNPSVLLRPLILTNDVVDPLKQPVISPKAASCTACHDTLGVVNHVSTVGGGTFGGKTQGQFLNNETFEACDGCHAPGGFVGVDTVHKIATQNVD